MDFISQNPWWVIFPHSKLIPFFWSRYALWTTWSKLRTCLQDRLQFSTDVFKRKRWKLEKVHNPDQLWIFIALYVRTVTRVRTPFILGFFSKTCLLVSPELDLNTAWKAHIRSVYLFTETTTPTHFLICSFPQRSTDSWNSFSCAGWLQLFITAVCRHTATEITVIIRMYLKRKAHKHQEKLKLSRRVCLGGVPALWWGEQKHWSSVRNLTLVPLLCVLFKSIRDNRITGWQRVRCHSLILMCKDRNTNVGSCLPLAQVSGHWSVMDLHSPDYLHGTGSGDLVGFIWRYLLSSTGS